MKLLVLRLENFQGIKKAEFELKGRSASIYGDNATGKTTVFNAITWLLFDKASTGAKNFTPKTKGPDGDLHNLNHSAEAEFDIDGRTVTFKKDYHEVYKKKRGSAFETFDGHTTDYYVDGVPSSEKEYQATIVSFCGDVEKMKMLTMPNYFSEEMSRDDKRKILLEICGDVGNDTIINSTPELKELRSLLRMPGNNGQLYSVDEYKKVASAKKSDINKQLQGIPGRIDEAQRAMPDIAGIDAKAIDAKIKCLNAKKDDLEAEKAQVLNGDAAMVATREQISAANAKLAEARAAYVVKNSSLNEGTYTAITNLKRQQIVIKARLQDAKSELEEAQRKTERLGSRRESLISNYNAVQKEAWDEGNETCPTCHRLLPEAEIKKLREEFNLHKSQQLEEINLQGQKEASKEMIAELDEQEKKLEKQIQQSEQTVQDYGQQISALQNQFRTPTPFEGTKEYAEITAQIAAYRDELNSTDRKAEAIAAGYTDKIQELCEDIRAQEELRARITIATNQQKRIAELDEQEKKLAQQYEEMEKGIYLCETFTKAKVSMLTNKINSKFQNVRFRLFQDQINGGLKDDCEVMIPDSAGRMVPFAFANNAGRINAGLEIIGVLAKHWGLSMPVCIDNAESVTRLLQMDTQIIRLVVSQKDPQLRLELN